MALDKHLHVELVNYQFIGDGICMTAAVRDMAAMRRCVKPSCATEIIWPEMAKEKVVPCPVCGQETLYRKWSVRVNMVERRNFYAIWENNPYLDDFSERDIFDKDGFSIEPDAILGIGTGKAVQESNTNGRHITEAYRISIRHKVGFQFPQGELIPDLHLTDAEKNRKIITGRYWIITPSKREKKFTSKAWPAQNWQQLIDSMPDITFVQIGLSQQENPDLRGDNLINIVGQTEDPRTGIRDLLSLMYNADGSIGTISMHAHIMAAFKKPAVVIAGAREPMRFEAYPWQRYLHNQGSMRCDGMAADGEERKHSGIQACWRDSVDACPNTVDGYTKCVSMITVDAVKQAVLSYYEGGALEPIQRPATIAIKQRPIFKMVCNAHAYGGGERSTIWIMNQMADRGYDVQLVPTKGVGKRFASKLKQQIGVTDDITAKCSILMLYTNDMVYGFKDVYKMLADVQTDRKIMVLNYRLGDAGKLGWTQEWDQYIFLCSDLRRGFIDRVPDANTMILPPPVDLTPFLSMSGSLNKTAHIVRISSQGGRKYPPNIREMVDGILALSPDTKFTFMGGHKSLEDMDNVTCHKEGSKPVVDILKQGTVFWYVLPDGYLDNGPRVIMEAMAAGLPVVADNRGGAADRITPETGWLCDSIDQHVEILSNLSGAELNLRGQNAKERAQQEFDPHKWLEVITDGNGN